VYVLRARMDKHDRIACGRPRIHSMNDKTN